MYNEEEAARPYARALVQAAQELGCLDRIKADIDALEAQWKGCAELRDWAMTQPSMSRQAHRETITLLWGDTMAPATISLLQALALNGLLAAIPHVINIFRRLAAKAETETAVEITFATEPSAETLETLTQRAKTQYGAQTTVSHRVDPSLGAGLIIRAGYTQIDGSLVGRLRRLRRAFAQ